MAIRAVCGGLLLAAAIFLCGLAAPNRAQAHALVGKQDLPIPEWLFTWGAAIVLIVSFVVLTTAWRTPRLQEERWRPVRPGLSRLLVNPVTRGIAGLIGVALLALVVYAGLEGTEAPDRNFSVVFVFVTFWLGLVLFSVLFGDLFAAFNPWAAIGRAVSGGFRLIAGQSAPAPLRYPERLGRWPAVLGVAGFLWLELVYATGTSTGIEPRVVAVAALIYSAITFVAMALFGVERWLERGEAFSAYFGMFSRLSPLEVREGRLGVRRPLSGAPSWGMVPGSAALILVTIGGTTFDGAQEGALSDAIESVFNSATDAGWAISTAFRGTNTLFLVLALIAVSAVYLLGVRGMRTVRGAPPFRELSRLFAHTLIPIGLAYLFAHYFSLFVYQEQAQFTYLLSDPLGDGSDLFGTAGHGIDYSVIGANAVWYVQVAALVVGHVAALTLAHDRAIALWKDPKLAARSQYWMLAVMVGFTSLGLYLLSQANA